MINNKCQHCNKKIKEYEDGCIAIQRMLCANCWLKWLIFHHKHYDRLHNYYKCADITWRIFSHDKNYPKLKAEPFIFR